jgi:hypothetical protein
MAFEHNRASVGLQTSKVSFIKPQLLNGISTFLEGNSEDPKHVRLLSQALSNSPKQPEELPPGKAVNR